MKKNFLLALAAIAIALVSTMFFGCVEAGSRQEFASCSQNSDCVLVQTICGKDYPPQAGEFAGCDCDTAINKNFLEKWGRARNETQCVLPPGLQCAPCPPRDLIEAKCVSGMCVIVRKPSAQGTPTLSAQDEFPPLPPDEFPTPTAAPSIAPSISPATNASGVECVSSEDCAPGGCSGQVCAPKSKEVITTCEWSPAYACFKYANCVCFNAKCGWMSTPAYLDCLKQVGVTPAPTDASGEIVVGG